jgi:hypothetical protein
MGFSLRNSLVCWLQYKFDELKRVWVLTNLFLIRKSNKHSTSILQWTECQGDKGTGTLTMSK